MSIFTGSCWSMELPDDWVCDDDDDYSVIYHPDYNGALQITVYSTNGEVSGEDLKELAGEYIQSGAEISDFQSSGFSGFTLTYHIDDETWQQWYVTAGQVALLLTYHYETKVSESGADAVKRIVASLSGI